MRRQVGESVHHLLALAQVVFIVEVGDIDHALEVVGLGRAVGAGFAIRQ